MELKIGGVGMGEDGRLQKEGENHAGTAESRPEKGSGGARREE